MATRASRGGAGPRGGRGGKAGRGARGGSTATNESLRPTTEADFSGQDAPASGYPAPGTTAERALTIDSRQSSTQSPAPATHRARFRPKNIRRDVSERQKLEEERERELAKKIKIEEREQRDADRRARRGRGRGGLSRGGFISRVVQGHGPFSAIPQDNVKQDGGGWSGATPSSFGGRPRYQDRRAGDDRVNVESYRTSVAPESSESPDHKFSGTLPIGIIRVEHKEVEAKVATSAELEAAEAAEDEDEGLFVDGPIGNLGDFEKKGDNEIWHAAPAGAVEPHIKSEPGTEEPDVMDIDSIPIKPASPELKKKVLAVDSEQEKAREKRREKALQDPEFRAVADDAQTLLNELKQDKTGRLYLFQFPPILPPLRGEDDIVDLQNSSDEEVQVKAEPGTTNPRATSTTLPPEGGYIGKLNVRRSGKVELDWGGRTLDLGIATDTDFLTTAIIVDEAENDTVSGAGKATGMGPVYNKFVLTPVFQEEEDWDPDLSGLHLEDP